MADEASASAGRRALRLTLAMLVAAVGISLVFVIQLKPSGTGAFAFLAVWLALPHAAMAGLLLALRTPSTETARALCAACLENGLLVATGRVARDTVVIRPSLLVTEAETDELAAALEAALRAVSSGA